MTMPSSPSGRRRGGQSGNTNRLVHGLYSRRLPRSLTWPANPRTGFDSEFEIALMRVHVSQLIERQIAASPEHYLAYERAIFAGVGRILSLMVAGGRRKRRMPDIDKLLDGLRMADAISGSAPGDDSNLIRTSAPWPGIPRD
jgi:hypothetical protein